MNRRRPVLSRSDFAVDGETDEQILVVRHEGARHQERSHGREIPVALAPEPIGAQRGAIRANADVAAGDVVGGHEAGHVIEGARGLDTLSPLADGKRDLRFPVDVFCMPVGIGISSKAPASELGALRNRYGREVDFSPADSGPPDGVRPARIISSTRS